MLASKNSQQIRQNILSVIFFLLIVNLVLNAHRPNEIVSLQRVNLGGLAAYSERYLMLLPIRKHINIV